MSPRTPRDDASSGSGSGGDRARAVRTPWRSGVVLVCRECDGPKGFGPKAARARLRELAKATLPRKSVRVLTVGCLDVCPKRSIAVATMGVSESTVVVSGPRGCATVIDRIAVALEGDG